MKQSYDLEKLRKIQTETAAKVILEDRFEGPIERVTGFDTAFLDKEAIAGAVTVNYHTMQVMEKKAIKQKMAFPYIPTFLSFREGPLIIKLVKRLKSKPDVLMLDSQGIAHPLFCGCASYVGVMLNQPTIGVAKSKLCGDYTQNPEKVGEWVPLRYEGRTVGAVLLSKRHCKPIFVSVGHMMTLETAIRVVKHFLIGHKIPEPIRLAHDFTNKIRRELRGALNSSG